MDFQHHELDPFDTGQADERLGFGIRLRPRGGRLLLAGSQRNQRGNERETGGPYAFSCHERFLAGLELSAI